MAGNPVIIPISGADRRWSFRDLIALAKGHLSLYIALTAVAGHALSQNRLSMGSIGIGLWVLLLSCGSGGLNNIQDRIYDRRAERTRYRVLARGEMSVAWASGMALGLMIVALAGLWLSCDSVMPVSLGVVAVCCYNGVYTPMKKRGTRARFWAMLPGTLCGMMPPAIGWAAVDKGMAATDPSGVFILMTGLGVWQFPHFLLVFLKEREALSHHDEYPLSGTECRTQVVIWSALFGISMMLFSLKGWLVSPVLSAFLYGFSLALPLFLAVIFLRPGPRRLDLGFWALNFTMLAYLVIILLDRI